jgi:hypothetical protein
MTPREYRMAIHIGRPVLLTAIGSMEARGKDARGVAAIDDKTSDTELDRFVSLGFSASSPRAPIGHPPELSGWQLLEGEATVVD